MLSVNELALVVGVVMACAALGVSRATWYRRQSPERARSPRKPPARALSVAERQQVLDTLNSERFMDQPPAEVYARLLDEDKTYLCSTRTMYRTMTSDGCDCEPNRRRYSCASCIAACSSIQSRCQWP